MCSGRRCGAGTCNIPAPAAQAIVKKIRFKRAERDLTNLRKVAAHGLSIGPSPEYPQTLLQIYDPPVMLMCAAIRKFSMRRA